MNRKYNRKEIWATEHGGAPVKCVLDVSKNMRYYVDLAASVNGLTSIQIRILGYLRRIEDEGKSAFQRDIEDVFRINRSSVTSVLQTLEKKELILREGVPGDARRKKLVLTENAKALQCSIYQTLMEVEQEIRSVFTEEEFLTFLDYMNRIDQKVIELYHSEEEKND